MSLLTLQFSTLNDYFAEHNLRQTDVSDSVVADFARSCTMHIASNQRSLRPCFLYQTIDECCAAANDNLRMSDGLDALIKKLSSSSKLLLQEEEEEGNDATATSSTSLGRSTLQSEGGALVASLLQEAFQAAEHVQVILMRKVNRTSIASDLFSLSWEDDWTHNEVTVELLQIFDLELVCAETFLSSDHLYHKTLAACCKAIVCFYIRCLVQKADSVALRRPNRDRMGRPGEKEPFRSPDRALLRMQDDVSLVKEFFRERTTETVALSRMLGDEMRILELIHECLSAEDSNSLETFVLVIHKLTGADGLVTRHFVSDLWMLTQRAERGRQLRQALSTLEPDLKMVSTGLQERLASRPPENSFVRVDQMLKALYEDRIVQGLLPVCWGCIPKSGEDGNEVVRAADKIRNLSRKLVELPGRLKRHDRGEQQLLANVSP